MKVAILIVNWNGFEDTKACLSSLAKHCKDADVLLLENGSGQEGMLREIIDSRTELFVSDKNLGFGGGNNVLIEKAIERGYDAVFLLNNDTEVTEGFLDEPMRLMEDPRVGFVNSKLILEDSRNIDTAGHYHYNSGDVFPAGRDRPASEFSENRTILSGCGAALLLRVEMLRQAGLFDESFFVNYEDVELTYRASAMGWKGIFCASSVVHHKLNRSVAKVRDDEYFLRSHRNALFAYFRNTPASVILLNAPWILLKLAGALTIGALFFRRDLRYLIGGWRRFISECRSKRGIGRRSKSAGFAVASSIFFAQRNFVPYYARILLRHLRSLIVYSSQMAWFITRMSYHHLREFNVFRRTVDHGDLGRFCVERDLPELYEDWYARHRCRPWRLMLQTLISRLWKDVPSISVVVPTYNSNSSWFEAALRSVAGQSYGNWECIVVDDASTSRGHLEIARKISKEDGRFKMVELSDNLGTGGACAEALKEASGEYLLVLDHDDMLERDALFEIAKEVRRGRPDLLYGDEMIVDEGDRIVRCEFRSSFDRFRLLSHPWIVHPVAIKRESLEAAGGFDSELKISQDYDVLLRVAAGSNSFIHLPRVLYRWRRSVVSTGHALKGEVMEDSLRSIGRHLEAVGLGREEAWVEQGPAFNSFRVRRRVRPSTVSVVVLTRDRCDLLRVCVESFRQKTRMPAGVKLEWVVVDNGSTCRETGDYLRSLEADGFRVIDMDIPFNFSTLNNAAVREAMGDHILFINNDLEVVESGWLEAMLEMMEFEDVGIVGSKLIYPKAHLIQHAGVIVGYGGSARHDHQFYPEFKDSAMNGGHGFRLLSIRECSAVTGACMLVRASAFRAAGGFDENLKVGFGDTDLCMKIVQAGYKCLYTPYARLIHHESATRGRSWLDPHPKDSAYFNKKWKGFIRNGDPHYSPNLSLYRLLYEPV